MPDVVIDIPHEGTMVATVKKLDQILIAARQEKGDLLAGLRFDRQGNVFMVSGTVKNVNLSGRITVLDRLVKVHLALPITAMAHRAAAEKKIREYLEVRLA